MNLFISMTLKENQIWDQTLYKFITTTISFEGILKKFQGYQLLVCLLQNYNNEGACLKQYLFLMIYINQLYVQSIRSLIQLRC